MSEDRPQIRPLSAEQILEVSTFLRSFAKRWDAHLTHRVSEEEWTLIDIVVADKIGENKPVRRTLLIDQAHEFSKGLFSKDTFGNRINDLVRAKLFLQDKGKYIHATPKLMDAYSLIYTETLIDMKLILERVCAMGPVPSIVK